MTMPDFTEYGFTPARPEQTGMGPFGPMSVPGAGPLGTEAERVSAGTTVEDMYLQLWLDNPEDAAQFMHGFNLWALNTGVPADPTDPELSRQFVQYLFAQEEEAATGPGGVGRVQFPSEAELDLATAALRREQAQSQEFERRLMVQQAELARQQAATQAFNRARDKFDLLQATDQLADARRQAATEALLQALPYMVGPGQQYTPGFEPFGAGQQLGQMLGANVPIQQMPTAELPLSELANPPLAAPPAEISAGLDPFLLAAGTPQI